MKLRGGGSPKLVADKSNFYNLVEGADAQNFWWSQTFFKILGITALIMIAFGIVAWNYDDITTVKEWALSTIFGGAFIILVTLYITYTSDVLILAPEAVVAASVRGGSPSIGSSPIVPASASAAASQFLAS